MNMPTSGRRQILFAILSLTISSLPRIWAFFNYPLAMGNDSATYIHLSNSLRNNLGFAKYNYTRTPGYPAFLILTGDQQVTYLAQLILGLLTTLLIFLLVWRLTHNDLLALGVSLAHSLNLGQLFFEASLLSEASSTFLFFLTLTFALNVLERIKANQPDDIRWLVVNAGLFGLTSLVMAAIRPLFLPVPFLFTLFILLYLGFSRLKLSLTLSLLIVLPITIATLFWSGTIYTRFHIIGLDAIGGFHIVNHVSSFFERAPAEAKQITDIFLQHRAVRLEQTGSAVNTIWDAIPELMEATKLNYYALSREMGDIASVLIRQNPKEYWANIALGWVWFWKVGVFWLPETIENQTTRAVLGVIMQAERLALIAINGIFLLLPLAVVNKTTRKWISQDLFLLFSMAILWLTSILQTFAEHGDNPRFLAPAQSLVVLIVVVLLYRWSRRKTDEK